MKKIIFVIVSIIFLQGCSNVGPFVSNISSDGKGNLIIEKQKIVHDGFSGILSTNETSVTTIRIAPEEKER